MGGGGFRNVIGLFPSKMNIKVSICCLLTDMAEKIDQFIIRARGKFQFSILLCAGAAVS